MSTRSSSLNNYTGTGITREIDSKYDNIKLVADNILKVDSISAAIADGSLVNAINISNMLVVQGAEGTSPSWDGSTLSIPKGDTGLAGTDAPTISSIVKTLSNGQVDTYTITLSDLTNYTFQVTNGKTPVKGVDYSDGAVGKSNYDLWLEDGNVGTLGQYLLEVKGEQGVQGIRGLQGLVGLPGENLTVEQIVYNGNGTFTWQFSDETSYTTPDLTGPQGAKGDTGYKGDQGVSVHHLKGTSTTDPEGDFGTFGELDTYTFYGDGNETLNLGSFVVMNGVTPEMTEGLGYMRRITYDTNGSGVVDNAEAVGGKSLLVIESERDAAIQAAKLALGTNYTVADNAARLALTELTVSDKVFVQNDGDGKWAQYWVVGITNGNGSTSTFKVAMDEDTYLNANTAASIKAAYESNTNTNAYTDADKVKVSHVTVTQAVNLDTIESDTTFNNTHRTGTGADHTYINQDVTTTATPTFAGVITNGLVDGRDVSVDGTKLDTIATGAQVNVATNLSYTASSRFLASSTGTDVTLPQVTDTVDGMMIAADKVKLNTIETGATADQIASEVPVTPVGSLASTNVQTALQEVQGDVDTRVVANAGIVAGTSTKITYDSKGLVTSGTILAAGDIPNLDTGKLTTGTLPVTRGGTGTTTSTGTGSTVRSTSPTLVTPVLGVATGTSFNALTGLATIAPLTGGTAEVGTSTLAARQDHVHPEQVNVIGNAGTATKLATARTIALTGDVTGSVAFDGSANATISAVVADDSHNHVIANVDGLQTALDSKVSVAAPTTTAAQGAAVNALTRKDYVDTKAPLASPALTGTPTTPTPATADNSTKVATTAFVKAQGYITSIPVAPVVTAGSIGSTVLAHERLTNNITKYNTGTRTVAGSALYTRIAYDPDTGQYSIDASSPGLPNSPGDSEPLGLTGTWINAQDMQNHTWRFPPTIWIRIA